jgi:hypothetical protein
MVLSGKDSAARGFDNRLEFLRSKFESGAKPPLRSQFEHRVTDAQGSVEVVYYPRRDGSSERPEQLTLFILGTCRAGSRAYGVGNPGLIDYYLPFLAHLYSLLPPTHAILCTSHIGHESHLPSEDVALGGLLETKIELVEALRTSLDAWDDNERAGRTKLVLVGHSLGGWLVCEIMKRLNTSDKEVVHAGHLLFPSLGWMAKTWNGRVMWVCDFHR